MPIGTSCLDEYLSFPSVWVVCSAGFALVLASRASYPAALSGGCFAGPLAGRCYESICCGASRSFHPLCRFTFSAVASCRCSLGLHRWEATAPYGCWLQFVYYYFLVQVQYFLRAYQVSR